MATLALLAGCSTGPGPEAPPGDQPVEEDGEGTEDAQGSRDGSSGEPDADASGADDGVGAGQGGLDAPSTDEEPPPPPPASRSEVEATAQRLLDGLLDTADEADPDSFGVLVVDEHGRPVLAHEPDTSLLPASTVKIVTAAAALTTFGAEATFPTVVDTTGPLTLDGVLEGDLVLIGSGDPVLGTERFGRYGYPARPRTPLEELADQLVDEGIEHVEGDLVAVAEDYEGPTRAAGWPDRYFSSFDARHAAGLTVDAGLRTEVSWPELDEWAELDDDQLEAIAEELGVDELEPDVLEADDAEEQLDLDLDLLDPFDPPDGLEPEVTLDHAADPAEQAGRELARLLEERDVELGGEVVVGEEPASSVGRLARVESPPLSRLLAFALQESDNQLADALFLATGRARTGVGSFVTGDRAVRQTLERFGVDHDGAVFADGSGLSRDDRVTARLLVEVEQALERSRHAGLWHGLKAITGESGTLSRRLRGTIAEGRFSGKTGTLRDVTGLVGTIGGDGGRTYHLAVLANHRGEARWLAQRLADELIVLLTADLDGCQADPGDGEDGPLGLPPLTVAC
ncbi:MAG: D-alanyl-D-alanine carboxypeptidase/D-alanyl-D-alanine-endopeptidase [Nitriliruptoraceae bacterium]